MAEIFQGAFGRAESQHPPGNPGARPSGEPLEITIDIHRDLENARIAEIKQTVFSVTGEILDRMIRKEINKSDHAVLERLREDAITQFRNGVPYPAPWGISSETLQKIREISRWEETRIYVIDVILIIQKLLYYIIFNPYSKAVLQLSWEQRAKLLDSYAEHHSGTEVAELAKNLFADPLEISSVEASPKELPSMAPETYRGLRGPETPPEFVKRVYGDWLGHGLTRAHVRKLDPKLYDAINNWLSRPGNEWPDDVDLPTLKEQNNRDIARLGSGDAVEILGKFTGKEAARLGAAIARRSK